MGKVLPVLPQIMKLIPLIFANCPRGIIHVKSKIVVERLT
jgi:hypothetical protein